MTRTRVRAAPVPLREDERRGERLRRLPRARPGGAGGRGGDPPRLRPAERNRGRRRPFRDRRAPRGRSAAVCRGLLQRRRRRRALLRERHPLRRADRVAPARRRSRLRRRDRVGTRRARIAGSGRVTIALPEPVRLGRKLSTLGLGGGAVAAEAVEVVVGVPHLVVAVPAAAALGGLDLASLGPPLRRHPEMAGERTSTSLRGPGPRRWRSGPGSGVSRTRRSRAAPGRWRRRPWRRFATRPRADRREDALGRDARRRLRPGADGLSAIRLSGDARLLYEGEIRWEEWS